MKETCSWYCGVSPAVPQGMCNPVLKYGAGSCLYVKQIDIACLPSSASHLVIQSTGSFLLLFHYDVAVCNVIYCTEFV